MERKLNKYLVLSSILILYAVLLLGNAINSDMFFTISSGRDLLNGNFSTISLANNQPAIIQQWLYAIFITMFDSLGCVGDVLCVFIQNTILWMLSYIFIYNKTKNKWLSITSPIIFICLLSHYLCSIRPETITIICLMSQILLLDKYKKSNDIKYLLWLIPLFILSANLHQSLFLYHFYIFIPYIMNKDNFDTKIIISMPLLFLCSFCTPYGINGSLFIFRTYKSHVFDLVYMKEVFGWNLNSKDYLSSLAVIITLLLFIYITYRRKINIYNIYFCLGGLLATSISYRHIILLYIGLIFCALYCKPLVRMFRDITPYICILTFSIALILASKITVSKNTNSNTTCHGVVKYLEDNDLNLVDKRNIKIYNSINLGGYLEYYGYNVVIDSRVELFTKHLAKTNNDQLLDTYINVELCNAKDLNTCYYTLYNYDYIILNNDAPIVKLLETNDTFIKVYSDGSNSIWRPIRLNEFVC